MKTMRFLLIVFFINFAFIPLAFPMGDAMMLQGQYHLKGKPAPDFTLNTSAGEKSSLSAVRQQKRAIIFFWATWCPHCRAELRSLNTRLNELQSQGIEIILVDLAESHSQVENYLKQNNIAVKSFLDEDNAVAEEYGIIGVPTLFFVGADGVVRAVENELPENIEKAF